MHPLQQKWHVATPAPASFLQSVHEHPLLAQVLYNRGLRTAAEVDAFLNGADVATVNPYKLRRHDAGRAAHPARDPQRRNHLRLRRL